MKHTPAHRHLRPEASAGEQAPDAFHEDSKLVAAMDTGSRMPVKSPFTFRQTGDGGLWMCEHFEQLV